MGLSSCFILLGSSLLYANSGTTSLEGLYIINSISDLNSDYISWYNSYYLNFSLLIFSIGFLFKVSAAPFHFWSPKKGLGKSLSTNVGSKLSNSGEPLKLLVLNHIWKYMSGWTNYSGIVISQKMTFCLLLLKSKLGWKNKKFSGENEMGYRGSKSAMLKNIVVKEQRVYGSWYGINFPYLRCTLMGFERNYQNKILTTQLVNKINYSTSCVNENKGDNNNNLRIDPNFITGFSDAEGSFVLSITKSNLVKSGWVIKPRFQIHLHKKDIFVLEAIKNYLGVGKIYLQGTTSVEYRVFSIKELKIVLDHFDNFPLLTQKYADYFLFKQAYLLLVNREHLTPEGLRKIISIKASINNGLSESLKEAFANVTCAIRPVKENIFIYNPQWLAGFASGDGSFGVKVRHANSNSKPYVELIFQINQHTRDKQLLACIAEYLKCGKIYKHSMNAVVYRVSKTSDLTEIIIPFFLKHPILGIKALDFKDFCSISVLTEKKSSLY